MTSVTPQPRNQIRTPLDPFESHPPSVIVTETYMPNPITIMTAAVELLRLYGNIHQGIEVEENSHHPYLRGTLRGTTSYVSDTALALLTPLNLVHPDALAVPSHVAFNATPLTPEQRQHCEAVARAEELEWVQEVKENVPACWLLLSEDAPRSWYPEYDPSPEALAERIDNARPWRAAEENVLQRFFHYLGLNDEPNAKKYKEYLDYMGNIQIPLDFFSWTQAEQAQWAQKLDCEVQQDSVVPKTFLKSETVAP